MPDRKNTHKQTTAPPSMMEAVAERYLDLWQDNVRRWATDPDALEKWLAEIKSMKEES